MMECGEEWAEQIKEERFAMRNTEWVQFIASLAHKENGEYDVRDVRPLSPNEIGSMSSNPIRRTSGMVKEMQGGSPRKSLSNMSGMWGNMHFMSEFSDDDGEDFEEY